MGWVGGSTVPVWSSLGVVLGVVPSRRACTAYSFRFFLNFWFLSSDSFLAGSSVEELGLPWFFQPRGFPPIAGTKSDKGRDRAGGQKTKTTQHSRQQEACLTIVYCFILPDTSSWVVPPRSTLNKPAHDLWQESVP